MSDCKWSIAASLHRSNLAHFSTYTRRSNGTSFNADINPKQDLDNTNEATVNILEERKDRSHLQLLEQAPQIT
jgi:hypothetical protein